MAKRDMLMKQLLEAKDDGVSGEAMASMADNETMNTSESGQALHVPHQTSRWHTLTHKDKIINVVVVIIQWSHHHYHSLANGNTDTTLWHPDSYSGVLSDNFPNYSLLTVHSVKVLIVKTRQTF